MAEHSIRLARAWELRGNPPDAAPPRRVDLPARWSSVGAEGPVRLLRRFGRPAVDPAEHAVALELADVPGLGAVRLNGRVVGAGLPGAAGPTRIALGDGLEPRNTLELDVDLNAAAPGSPWGMIALVIGPRPG